MCLKSRYLTSGKSSFKGRLLRKTLLWIGNKRVFIMWKVLFVILLVILTFALRLHKWNNDARLKLGPCTRIYISAISLLLVLLKFHQQHQRLHQSLLSNPHTAEACLYLMSKKLWRNKKKRCERLNEGRRTKSLHRNVSHLAGVPICTLTSRILLSNIVHMFCKVRVCRPQIIILKKKVFVHLSPH